MAITTISRYSKDSILSAGKQYGTAQASVRIRKALDNNQISFKTYILKEGERLDQIAGREYNDGSMWWIIAAASKIGWGLQIPPGTVLTIPINLEEISNLV